MSDFNLGTVTAYGYAKDKGYTGTEDEFAALMASYADVAEQAAESAEQAAASATTATAKASEAAQSATAAASSKTAAETAQGGAETAAQTATTKAGEASTAATTATNKATEATTAATTATGKATEAAGSATTATTKAGEASTSATNAAASATRAQEILDSIPEDYSQLSEDVSDLKEDYTTILDSAYVTDTASGSIASFPDGADGVPVKSLKVNVEPVQDLHGQERPYPSGSTDNLLHATNYGGSYNRDVGSSLAIGTPMDYSINSDGTIAVAITREWSGRLFATDALSAGEYSMRLWVSSSVIRATWYVTTADLTIVEVINSQSSAGWGSVLRRTIAEGQRIALYVGANTATSINVEFQVNSGSSIKAIVPFENICPISGHTSAVVTVSPTTDAQDGTSYTIDLDGTRYGGTLDVTTGVLTVDRKYRLLNGVNGDGVTYAQNGHIANTTRAFVRITDKAYGANNMISSYFFYQASGDSVGIMIGRAAGNGVEFFLNPSVPDTEEGVKAWFAENPTDLVYELAEPFTVQLTAEEVTTLKGTNNIWNDCGDTTVEYRADTKLYIQKVLNA